MDLTNEQKKVLAEAIQRYNNSLDKHHGLNHVTRVKNVASRLATSYPEVNPEDVIYASMLHDVGHDREWVDPSVDHALDSAESAKRYLAHLPSARVSGISQAILEHMGKTPRTTILGKIVADADRLAYTPRDAAIRAVTYRKNKGIPEDEAIRKAYWHVRNSGSIHRSSTIDRLELPESKALARERIAKFDEATKTFIDFQKLLGIKNPVDYIKKEAALMDARTPEELLEKLSWVEAAMPSVTSTPYTKQLIEMAVRRVGRGNARGAAVIAANTPQQPSERGTDKDVLRQ